MPALPAAPPCPPPAPNPVRPAPVRRSRSALRRLRIPRRAWPRVLRAGLLLWLSATAATAVTGNPNLVPAVMLLGAFLVPVTCVVAAWEHRRPGSGDRAGTGLVVRCAVVGGVYSCVVAALAEDLLSRPGGWLYTGVGVIEETAKLLALLWCTRAMPYRTVRDGMVLGASVGFGFAAVESAGYAFDAMFTPTGLSFGALVDTEALRAALAPFGHGLWTAVLGAAWFAAFPQPLRARLRRARPAPVAVAATPVRRRLPAVATAAAAWVSVAGLHAAFDAAPSLVATLTGPGPAFRVGDAVATAAVTAAGLAGLQVARRRAERHNLPDLVAPAARTDTVPVRLPRAGDRTASDAWTDVPVGAGIGALRLATPDGPR